MGIPRNIEKMIFMGYNNAKVGSKTVPNSGVK
jgi:hypothetical protein